MERLAKAKHNCSLKCCYCQATLVNQWITDEQGVKHPATHNNIKCGRTGHIIKQWKPCSFYTETLPRKKYDDNDKTKIKLIVFLGKSAAGKDTAINYFNSKYNIKPIVSHTSRPIRPNEVNGVEYHFISKDNFQDMINKQELLEYRKYYTFVGEEKIKNDIWYYGISKEELNSDTVKTCTVDITGLHKLIEYFGYNKLAIIYIDADSDLRKERAESRGGFNLAEWERRLMSDDNVFNIQALEDVNLVIDNNSSLEELYERLDELYTVIFR